MASETTIELHEGDVFDFQYSPEELARRFEPRHCFDGQVVVRNGKLYDTYWAGYRLSPGYSDQRIVTPEQGTLTFICNLNDVERIEDYNTRYYDDADVFNLSYQHGCYKHFVVRKGAKRSAEKMLTWIRAKRAELKHQIDNHIRHLESLAGQEARIERGDTEVSVG